MIDFSKRPKRVRTPEQEVNFQKLKERLAFEQKLIKEDKHSEYFEQMRKEAEAARAADTEHDWHAIVK